MAVLYKYVTGDRVLKFIPEVGDGTLRATQPAALNDPFECAVNPSNMYANEEVDNRTLARVITELDKSSPITADDVRRARRDYGRPFARQLVTKQLSARFGIASFTTKPDHSRTVGAAAVSYVGSPPTLEHVCERRSGGWNRLRHYGRPFARQLVTKQLSARFGIASFTTKPDHPLMWAHYAGAGTGFVIGYDSEELRKLRGPSGWLEPVNYIPQPPEITNVIVEKHPEYNLPFLLYNKSDHWSYEEERRLIVELSRQTDTGKKDAFGHLIHLIRVPNEAVVSVYFTERAKRETVEAIQNRLADRGSRYLAERPRKLIMSYTSYRYEESSDGSKSYRR